MNTKKAKKKKSKTPKDVVPVHFPAKHLPPEVSHEDLKPLPPAPSPETIPDFKEECKVTLGTTFWRGTVYVHLESTSGQDLTTLLHDGQIVTLLYKKGE